MLSSASRINCAKSSSKALRQMRWFFLLIFLSLFFCLGCSPLHQIPPTGDAGAEDKPASAKIVPPQIIPSIHNLPAPPILGVNYIETIGRPGQGAGQFLQPIGLALDHRGQLYVADSGNNRVQVVDDEGNFIAEYGTHGWRTGEFDTPTDVAINFQRTELLYVADTGNNRVQYCNLVDRIFRLMAASRSKYDDGGDEADTAIELDLPGGVGIGRNGEIYVLDTGNHRFIRFNTEGLPALIRGGFGRAREQLRNPTDLIVDPHGNVYIVDSGNHRIKKYDFSGNLVKMWGTEGEAPGQFREPSHIALDRWNYLYVTDRGNGRVQVFKADGQAVMEFNGERLVEPAGITISRDNRIFVSDIATNSIKVFQIIYRPLEKDQGTRRGRESGRVGK